jgi:hypothetical protein
MYFSKKMVAKMENNNNNNNNNTSYRSIQKESSNLSVHVFVWNVTFVAMFWCELSSDAERCITPSRTQPAGLKGA